MLLILPLAAWPERHRRAWEWATTPPDSLFAPSSPALNLKPRTLEIRRDAFGLWLSFLARHGLLDPDALAATALTPQHLDAFVAEQRVRGNSNGVIARRCGNLHAALRMLEPEADLGFMLRPSGMSLRRAFPHQPRPVLIQDARDLLRRTLALYESGCRGQTYADGRTGIRDAALLGILVTRAPRVGSLAVMEIGRHLVMGDAHYRVSFGEADIKTGRPLTYDLDKVLTPILDHYLGEVRPAFGGAETLQLWLGTKGYALNAAGLAKIVRRRTTDWFETGHGPHWFRKCLTTTAVLQAPHLALDVAAVLGHSPETSLRNYNLATAVEALRRHDRRVSRLKRETAGLAARAFRSQSSRASENDQAARQGERSPGTLTDN